MSIESYELKIAQIAKRHLPDTVDEEIKSYLKGLPSDISQNGLLQTMTFIKGKGEGKYAILYNIFDEFFHEHFENRPLLTTLLSLDDMQKYHFYQRGFLAYAIWLKRLVLALR